MYIGKRVRLNFKEFYYQLLHQLNTALTTHAPISEPEEKKTDPPEQEASEDEKEPEEAESVDKEEPKQEKKESDVNSKLVLNIQKPLVECLAHQLKIIREDYFGEQRDELTKGVYLAAALADELYLNHEWFGRSFWKENMIEYQLFETQQAGETIPDDLSEIIAKPQKFSEAIIEIYFLLLSLGFKGGMVKEDAKQYQKKLLNILFPAAPFLFDQRQTELMPGTERSLISTAPSFFRFLDTRRWILTWLLFMLIFVIITTYFWYYFHKDISYVIRELNLKTLRLGRI